MHTLIKASETSLRIIAEEFHGHWSARFAAGSPGSFGGPDAFTAIRRLIENSPTKHLTLDDFEPDLEECRLNRVEMVLIDRWEESRGEPCPDCGGTGKYVGLTLIETCATCRGTGIL